MTQPSATVRTVLLTLTAAGTLLVAFLLGSARADSPTSVMAPGASGGTRLGTITMTGKGEISAVPDQLGFKVAVTKQAPDVAVAMDRASRAMGRVLAALEETGVTRKDTESTGLSVDPQYRYHETLPPELTGYRVRQSMSVVVRELSDGGRAIAEAVEAGGNAVRVNGITLSIEDQDALVATARTRAVEDATAKAAQYAEATGQPLGQVLTVREGKRPGRTVRETGELRGYAADRVTSLKDVPIRAGSRDLEIEVTLVWSLDG